MNATPLTPMYVALQAAGMEVWSVLGTLVPCRFQVNQGPEFVSFMPIGFEAEGTPDIAYLPMQTALDLIWDFVDLMGDPFYDRFASEAEAATLWLTLVRAAGDNVHRDLDRGCKCVVCNHQRRRAELALGARA